MALRPILFTLFAAAPTGALAFGDMDCVSLEICRDGACAGEALPLTLRFEWPTPVVALTSMIANDLLSMSDTPPEGMLAAFAGDGTLLTFHYEGDDLFATYTRTADELLISAQCAPEQAA